MTRGPAGPTGPIGPVGGISGASSLNIANPSPPTGFEFGSLVAVDVPFMDWHSSGTGSDYDVRMTVAGGNGTPGNGYLTILGNLIVTSPNIPTGFEFGRPGSADSPFMDWHSSGTGSDYDVRLIANGGSATPGQGVLVLTGNLQIASTTTSASGDKPALLITPASGLSQGIAITQTSAGTLGYAGRSNAVSIEDTAVTQLPSYFYEGWTHTQHVHAGFGGGRNAMASYLYIDGAPGVGLDTNGAYVAFQGLGIATANVGGTNLTTGTHGSVYGLGAIGMLQNGATNYLNVTGAEFNVSAMTGSSVKFKSVIQLSGQYADAVNGSSVDAMIWAYNQASGAAKFNDFILIDATNNFWPIATTGNILRTNGSASITNGIDISSLTITGSAFKSTGFSVDGSGNVTAPAYKVGANQVVAARDTGWAAMTGTPDKATAFATSTVTLAQLAGRVMAMQTALTTHGLLGA